jgi:hypothetical protein
MSDLSQAKVVSLHSISGKLLDKEKEFMEVEDALVYAKTLECISVQVFQRDKGIILYQRPQISE